MRYLIASLVFPLTAFVLMLVPHYAQATPGSSASPKTVALIEDHDSKSFRFVIEGKEVARLDQSGLHVSESIEYGGVITDVGVDNYDNEPAAPQGAAE